LNDENDPFAQLETKIIRKVYVWLVVVALGVGSVGGTGVLRTGKFTSQDAQLMRYEIEEVCQSYVDSYYRPPVSTRIRIQAIEETL